MFSFKSGCMIDNYLFSAFNPSMDRDRIFQFSNRSWPDLYFSTDCNRISGCWLHLSHGWMKMAITVTIIFRRIARQVPCLTEHLTRWLHARYHIWFRRNTIASQVFWPVWYFETRWSSQYWIWSTRWVHLKLAPIQVLQRTDLLLYCLLYDLMKTCLLENEFWCGKSSALML